MGKINIYKFMTFINFGNKYVQKFKHEDPTMKPKQDNKNNVQVSENHFNDQSKCIYIARERDENE